MEIQPSVGNKFWNTYAFGHIRLEDMQGEIIK